MSRHRSISTDISTDTQVAELAEHGTLALLLYTWAIPHADDWGRMSGDPRQFKLLVCPGLDITIRDVDDALTAVADAGLWLRYEVKGKRYIAFPPRTWFKHQSYIARQKRSVDGSAIPAPENPDYSLAICEDSNDLPQIPTDHQESPQNTASPSPSPSLTPSLSLTPTLSPSGEDPSNPNASPSVNDAEAMDASAPSRAQARTKKTASSKPENVTNLPTERARNPIWDTLVEIFGYAPSTAPERSNWGKCVKELNKVNATPEDMRVRAARYIERYPRARLTPNALVSHWGEFASDTSRGTASPPSQPRAMAANGGPYPRTRAPEPEPYYEPYDAVKHSPWNSAPSEPSPLLARMRKVAPITAESE